MSGFYPQKKRREGQISSENDSLLHAAPLLESYDSITPVNTFKEHKKNQRRLYYFVISLVGIFLVTFFGLNLYLIAYRGQDYINQAVEVDVKHVELQKLTTKGIYLEVEGLNVINYDSIDDNYFRKVFKLGGGIFQTADLKLDSVNLQTVIQDEVISIGTVDIPKIEVQIGNNQKTKFNMVVSIHPATTKILGLIKELLTHPDKIFRVYGSTMLNIQLGYLPIGTFKVDFIQDIVGSSYFQFDGDAMNFQDLTITQEEERYDVDFTLSVPNPIKNKLFAFHIPSLGWELLAEDCSKQLAISLFDHAINTDSFKISPLDDILSINVSTAMSKLDPRLQQRCLLNGDSTPISTIIDEFVNNKSLPLLLRNIQGSSEYPGFINEILRNVDLKFDYKSNFDIDRLINNVSIDHLEFEFQNGDVDKPLISGDINLYLGLPKGLNDVKIDKIRGLPALYHDGIEFGKINLEEWHSCGNKFEEELLFVSFRLNQEEIRITNKRLFSKVINEVLSSGSSKIFIDAVLDCLLTTLLGEFEIDEIHAKSESDITRGMIFKGWSKLMSSQ